MWTSDESFWDLDADQTEKLPVSELAIGMLSVIDERHVMDRDDWFLRASQNFPRSSPALDAMAEAWDWLHAQGLIARSPGPTSEQQRFIVTRKGKGALTSTD